MRGTQREPGPKIGYESEDFLPITPQVNSVTKLASLWFRRRGYRGTGLPKHDRVVFKQLPAKPIGEARALDLRRQASFDACRFGQGIFKYPELTVRNPFIVCQQTVELDGHALVRLNQFFIETGKLDVLLSGNFL
jgi:hypothetical protein